MARFQTLQDLFKRYRRPGDLVFAVFFLLFSILMLAHLGEETEWAKRTKLFAQPAFWPAISLVAMTVFAFLHWISSAISPRLPGRWTEVAFWLRSVEYALWFMAYVSLVPQVGYLPTTIVFTGLLAFRLGYRTWQTIGGAMLTGVVIVVVFKSFLQVKVPGGEIYESLPDGLRSFMLTYF